MNTTEASLLLKISQTSSLQELVNLSCELMQNPIFIDDMTRTVLAYSQNVEIEDPLWQSNVVENLHDESLQSFTQAKKLYVRSLETHHPVLLNDDLPTAPRYAMTLTYHGHPIGNMTVASHIRPFQESDVEVFELLCGYASKLLANSHYSLQQSQSILINTLILLLDGTAFPKTTIENKLTLCGLFHNSYHYLMVLSDKSGDAFAEATGSVIREFSCLPDTLAFSYQNHIVCLYSSDTPMSTEYQNTCCELLHQYNLFAGISNCFSDYQKLEFYYQTAIRTVQISLQLYNEQKRLCAYEDIAIFDLFHQLSDHMDLLDCCDKKLLDLAHYDQEHEQNLLLTLQVYLENCLQYNVASAKLFIHKNTVRYRIGKCREFLETDFSDGEQIFRYIFSLKILKYYHYF